MFASPRRVWYPEDPLLRRRGLTFLLAVMCAASALGAPAHAKSSYPQPAGGPSASGDPEIIFTFDDGPHERWTAPLLDVLARYRIKGLFFWAGWRVRRETPMSLHRREVLARALREGHAVGNHTVNHAKLCVIPAKDAELELDENARLLERLTGLPMIFMRAPYGARCKRLDAMLAARGLSHLHWDMDPQEWEIPSSEHVRDYLIDRIGKLQGRAIILLHDTKYTTVKALPQVLDWIERENARRVARGQRPIRILSYADLALEQIPAEVRSYVDTTTAQVAALVPDVARTLLAPLASPAPPAVARPAPAHDAPVGAPGAPARRHARSN
jgi:peptidoglycan/xylan/chitin deacetylase (PgdA/CDA1 family)